MVLRLEGTVCPYVGFLGRVNKESNLEEPGKEVSHSHTQHARYTQVPQAHVPLPPHPRHRLLFLASWEGKVKGQLPKPQLLNVATPAIYKTFLLWKSSFPSETREMWLQQAPYRQRNREMWHLSPRHTAMLSPTLSDPVIDIASPMKAPGLLLQPLPPLYFLPTEEQLSVVGWARQGAPTWSMAMYQSLDKHYVD